MRKIETKIKVFPKKLIVGSTDYDVLNLLPFNRTAGVRKYLESSIRENGFTDEIKVVSTSAIDGGRKKLYIVDGQNRYFTARAMNSPIDYIVERETDDLNEIARMVVTYNSRRKAWAPMDYVNLFVYFQNQHYILLKRICVDYDLTVITVSQMLSGKCSSKDGATNSLKEGTFSVTHEYLTFLVLREISEIKRVVPVNNTFVTAFYMFYSLAGASYDREAILRGLKSTSAGFSRSASTSTIRNTLVVLHDKFSNKKLITI